MPRQKTPEKGQGLSKELEKASTKQLEIAPPNMKWLGVTLTGTSPLMIHAFSEKAILEMEAKHRAGSVAASKKKAPRDFDADYKGAFHQSREGWSGAAASSFRNAMISACRLTGYPMTRAKLSFFIEAEGYDARTGDPLVRVHGEPIRDLRPVRNDNGSVDLRVRPRWDAWKINLVVKFDGNQFGDESVINLLLHAGGQVGICEGRPDSKDSAGMGFGLWDIDRENVRAYDHNPLVKKIRSVA